MKRDKKESSFIISCSEVFSLPPVAARHFRNPFKIPFSWKIGKCPFPGGGSTRGLFSPFYLGVV